MLGPDDPPWQSRGVPSVCSACVVVFRGPDIVTGNKIQQHLACDRYCTQSMTVASHEFGFQTIGYLFCICTRHMPPQPKILA